MKLYSDLLTLSIATTAIINLGIVNEYLNFILLAGTIVYWVVKIYKDRGKKK